MYIYIDISSRADLILQALATERCWEFYCHHFCIVRQFNFLHILNFTNGSEQWTTHICWCCQEWITTVFVITGKLCVSSISSEVWVYNYEMILANAQQNTKLCSNFRSLDANSLGVFFQFWIWKSLNIVPEHRLDMRQIFHLPTFEHWKARVFTWAAEILCFLDSD